MVTEQNEWRTQNTKSTVENPKKPNYLTTLCLKSWKVTIS